MTDWTGMSAAELGRAIEAGRADPRDLTEAFLERIAREDAELKIFARATPERARMEAEEASARAKSGTRRSALDGVPISWKDLFDTAGVATESGTRLLAGRVPAADARVVENTTRMGAICLGKTHQTEFAFSGLGVNPKTATPPNRKMPGHAPGGSSSGAAASLTHDLAALAIGSDTGGSVRIPAAWNNLVGLKTTHGLLSNEGVVPLCPGFDTVGPLARCVEDAALALAMLAGEAAAPLQPRDVAGLNFAVAETIVLEGCDEAVIDAFEAALARLATAGATIERLVLPSFADVIDLGPALFPFEAWQSWGELIAERGDEMHAPVRSRFEQGIAVTREQYETAWAEMDRQRAIHEDRIAGFDAVLTPSVAILPPRADALLADDDFFTARNLLTLRNTRFVNLLGGAALTLPLPEIACGLQLIGPAFSEARLLATGLAIEQIVAE